MLPLMKTAPVSDMGRKPSNVLEMTKSGPVALMARSDPAAILVSPEEWNRIAEELRRLRILAEARQIEARTNAAGTWISDDDLVAQLAERGIHVDD